MTPEIMWKFGRLGSFALSPDGSNVLYTVTDIDLKSEARRTNIFRLSASGGDPCSAYHRRRQLSPMVQ